jgi:hypothetical protein
MTKKSVSSLSKAIIGIAIIIIIIGAVP